MRFLLNFLYYRRRVIAVILLVAAVFVLFMALYGVPIMAYVYAGAICGVITVGAAVGDFLRYYRKYRLLCGLQYEILFTLEHLPDSDNEVEQRYQRLLETLHTEKTSLISAADKRYDEAVMYFTMWAHQIKTPIAAMSLSLQELDTEESRELSENLQKIEQYVEMALCYVRLDSETSDFVLRRHSLDDIIKQALRKFSPQFIRRRIKLVYEPTETDVLTDEKWLLFVVEQLISNALKYTKSGSVQITLKPEKTLSIRDTGIGIAPEDLPRVFERGFTGNNGRADKKATGIGLYLCRRICKALGHEIEIRSDKDGTEVFIDLAANDVDTRE
ncbi:MAG: HAMP domain-containing histidine kinase [Ruminococcaceae bacterium]|nr:HAMP domain-containing histidine kinase [Oscillospiraceae bacterium]